MEHTLISKVESLEKQTALHKLQIDELTRKMLANKRKDRHQRTSYQQNK